MIQITNLIKFIVNKTNLLKKVLNTLFFKIELIPQDNLIVRIINTGNVATGNLTLALSGPNADAFTLFI